MKYILDKSDYITHKSQLTEYFLKNCKNRSDFKVGIEVERLGVDSKTFHAAPYSGKNGIAEFLKQFKKLGDFEEVQENGNILGLKDTCCCDISLEPGCQFECSTKPLLKLKEHEKNFIQFSEKCRTIGEELGITWIGYGIQPLSTFDTMEMIPKQRYNIMRNYLPTKGSRSPVMMLETAGLQTSIDYESEEDAMKKLKVSLGISPIMTAMFVNSPIRGGKLTGYKSYRANAWLDTDNDRCGLISRKIFEGDFGFEDYVDILLDVPMFFKKTGMPFREYMKTHRVTMDDWLLHMTTFFPDVRLKNFLEIRNCDCQKADMTLAFSALIKGIMYNDDALGHAWDLVKDQSWHERNELRNSVPKQGLSQVAGIARDLVSIAEESLSEEAVYLEKLKELVLGNKTPADIIIMNWDLAWGKDLKKLIHYSSL
ncbi:MAG: hypothetical protein A2Y25_04595 [Candidatus Melainabacteria bacterium GWF2_37_15]|nr:MAG: hypothetical protein A2Y25_04595 [Candidatus Melainabacteria bacterium GWF2_37_15]